MTMTDVARGGGGSAFRSVMVAEVARSLLGSGGGDLSRLHVKSHILH